MDINRLYEFQVLAEQLNYSKAANLLFITQPVLSRHIRDLEDTLGGQLFVRDTHNVHLTEFGAFCAEQLGEVVKAYDSALMNIRSAADTSEETLTVGFMEYAVRPFLNKFAAWFETAHPNIEIEYISGDLDDLTDAVLNDQMDLAFVTHVGSSQLHEKDLDSELIYEDGLIAVFPSDHPCSGRESITIRELAEYPQINFSKSQSPETADFQRSIFESRGLNIEVVKEVNSFESGLFYAGIGAGFFVIPQHLSFLAGDLAGVPIADEDCTIPVHLVWKKLSAKQSQQTYVRDFKLFYGKMPLNV